MFAGVTFAGAAYAGLLGLQGALPPLVPTGGIEIGGVPVANRVRLGSLTIRDVLNDAPNTCTFTMQGEAPAVGQRVRVTWGQTLLFAGAVQTIDQAYESKPEHVAWQISAIDDTAEANARRPFGTFIENPAWHTAHVITGQFAPGFSVAGIALDLPPVTIVFDGSETFIACLARLAAAVGGYCKIEDRVVHLFRTDPYDPPAPIDPAHRFLTNPPIQMNTDSSQLRTRVYGKGYGEPVQADINPGETLLPIQDGAQFPPLGGTAIAGLTADGAQSEKIAFASVALGAGGSLVGPGSAPGAAPGLELQVGSGVTSGPHTLSVAYLTANGMSLAGPPAEITTGTHAPPATAPVAGTATSGTGPDQGSHDYAASFVTSYGETVAGAISNAIATSAASGQLPPPTVGPFAAAQPGAGVDTGLHDYVQTFENAQGETQAGPAQYFVSVGPILTGQLPPPSSGPTMTPSVGAGVDAGAHYYGVTFGDANGDTTVGPLPSITVGNGPPLADPSTRITATVTSGGSIQTGDGYWWTVSFSDGVGETLASAASNNGTGLAITTAGQQAANLTNIPIGPAGTIRRFIYRFSSGSPQSHLVATIENNTTTSITEGLANASVGRLHPGANTTGIPYHVVNLTNIPTGPPGTTDRKIWRQSGGFGPRYVGTVAGNLTTTLTDTTPNASLGAAAPASNTTGSMQPNNQIQVSNIQTGPGATTSRRLYRRFNQSGAYLFVAELGNNTATSYLDTKSNAQLGAEAPTSNTTGTAVQKIPVTNIPLGPPGVTARKLYRRFNGAGTFKLVTTIANNTGTTFTDAVANAALGAAALTTATAIGNQILVTLPKGPQAVTARALYMSPSTNPTRRYILTINDNSTPSVVVTTSDAAIIDAALEPGSDTSGLQQPTGQVNPGAAVIPVASSAPFRPGGGWVTLAGGQTVRYTGISAQTLVGVPASGSGAITTTVLYGSQALPAPMLVGVTGLTRPMLKGGAVHIWIQRDDLLAQQEHAARTGGDGIVEFLIVDQRRGVESLTARCDADLALFSRPIITVSYATRDLWTKSGKPITVNLPAPLSISQALTIQEVTITEIDIAPGLPPRFTVRASSVRFSLEDTLRRLIAGGQTSVNT